MAKVNEAWAIYQKCKRDNRAPIEEEKKEEENYQRFLTNRHGRLPRLADGDPYMAEFIEFLLGSAFSIYYIPTAQNSSSFPRITI